MDLILITGTSLSLFFLILVLVLKNSSEKKENNLLKKEEALDPFSGESLKEENEIEFNTKKGKVKFKVDKETYDEFQKDPKAVVSRLGKKSNDGKYHVYREDTGWDLIDYYLFYTLFIEDNSEYNLIDEDKINHEYYLNDESEFEDQDVVESSSDNSSSGDMLAGAVVGAAAMNALSDNVVEDSVAEDAMGDFVEESSSDDTMSSGDES